MKSTPTAYHPAPTFTISPAQRAETPRGTGTWSRWGMALALVASTFVLAGPQTAAAAVDSGQAAAEMRLWYASRADAWTSALPLGNGRLGAMVHGGVGSEHMQLNEDTVWAGQPHDYSHEGAAEVLPEIRRLLFDGKQAEAEELAGQRFMSVPLRQKAYQKFVDLDIDFDLSECHEPLYSALADLAQSGARVAKVHYDADGWVVHHNFDLWRGAAPINNPNHGIWPTGGSWLCQHLWFRCLFTGDREWLREVAYRAGGFDWDAKNLKAQGNDKAQELIRETFRKGWAIA